MFDVTNKQSFDSLPRWSSGLVKCAARKAPKARILVVGNKKDLESGRVNAAESRPWTLRTGSWRTIRRPAQMDGKSVEHLLATRIYDELVVPNDAGAIGADFQVPEGIMPLG